MSSNILVIYDYAIFPLRTTIKDHLYCFREYSNQNVYYLNLAYRSKIPNYFKKIKFDVIIFHTIFANRWDVVAYNRSIKKAEYFKKYNAVKIYLPQDEFLRSEYLCKFINDFKIDNVFTVSPISETHKIYAGVDFNKVNFYEVLTGYLDQETIKRINKLSKSIAKRPIDVGYRAWRAVAWLGRHGILKTKLSNVFEDIRDIEKSLVIDCSTKEEDTLLGDDWYRFLLKCKYTIGVEGGASVLDKDGMIKKATEEYIKENPNASFDEIEERCFPNEDGKLSLFAISPRHLEACATKTCQILIEGSYNGILKPHIHYIPLKRNFENLNEVINLIKNDSLRKDITERAYHDIVESNIYSYQSFVKYIFSKVELNKKSKKKSFIFYYNFFDDKYHNIKIKYRRLIRDTYRKLRK